MTRLLVGLIAAVGLWGAAPDSVAWTLAPPAKAVKAGTPFAVKLTARIEPGWHMYSMKPAAEGPIPTRIWIDKGQPFQLAGAIEAAEPVKVKDPALDMEVETYEGEVEFSLPVKASSGGEQKLVVSASYQSCNNMLCLPPKTVKVEIPVVVGK